MSKNKAKKADTRAKKAHARAKDRQIEKAREAARFREKSASSLAHFTSNPQTGYEFWLLHGLNFLLSSYEEGVWSPAFPEVYTGKAVARTVLFRRVLDRCLDPKTNSLTPSGTKSIVWTSLKPKEMFALVFRAKRLAGSMGGNSMSPAQPQVWKFLHEVMEEFTRTLDASGKTDEGSITLPVDQYGKVLPQAVADTIANLSGVSDPADGGRTETLP